MKKKTLIASQDDQLRYALEFLLDSEPSAQIAGSINSAAGLLALAKAVEPDLVLLDWDIPDRSGPELIAAILRINPVTKTIVFSNSVMESQVRSAGADVCITKGSPPDLILENVRSLFERSTQVS